jgi:DNA-binding Lrp family transcriptional regulator
MTENGTIVATRTIVAPELIGQNLTIILEITLENETSDWGGGSTRQALLDDPRVQHCYFVTGETDLFAIVAVPTMDDYKQFTDRHFLRNTNIKKFRTSVVMDRIKATTVFPV